MRKLFTTKEASEITGYGIETLRAFVRSGKLKVIRITPGAQMRFKENWLMNLTNAPKLFKDHKEDR